MRAATIAGIAVLLTCSACQRPEVQACRSFAEEAYGLAGGDLAEVHSVDAPLSARDLARLTVVDAQTAAGRMRTEDYTRRESWGDKLGMRLVRLGKSGPACAFLLDDGKVSEAQASKAAAHAAALRTKADVAIAGMGSVPRREAPYPCCM